MPSALEQLQSANRDRTAAARAFKAAGGKVVGYICETVPEELIMAAGFLPYRLSGEPGTAQAAQARYVHPFAAKGFSNARNIDLEYVNSICSLVLEGRYDFLDHLVISNTRKLILLVYRQILDAAAAYKELIIPELYLLDRAQTQSLSSAMFNRERVLSFCTRLEAWSGRAIDEAQLAAAIRLGNEVRAVLRQVRDLRVAGRLSGAEALAFYGAARTMPKGDFIALARAALAEVPGGPGGAGKRVFVCGSPLDHDQLVTWLEARGARVVGDDYAWGDRSAEDDVPERPRPIEALVDHYEALQPLIYPMSASALRTVTLAKAAGAAGVVINICEHDDIKLWEAPDEVAALEAQGVPTLHLTQQPYGLGDTTHLARQVVPFLDALPGEV